MAITAAMTISSATAVPNQSVTATCTVTNSATSAVNVLSVTPTATPHSGTTQSVPVALGVPPLGPGMTVAVAGSNGTLAIPFGVVPYAPQPGELTAANPANPTSYVYDIGALVYTSDGAITAATVTTLTVTAPTH